jgi:putative ABC transport system permease protein
VKDVRYSSLRAAAPLMVYRPARQDAAAPATTLLVRTSSSPAATAGAVRQSIGAEIRAAAPALPPPSVVSLDDRVASVLVEERMLAALSSALGGLAAVLAAIGIYSTVASRVARRQREIGIRMALGARPGDVSRMIVGDVLTWVAAGALVGIPVALAAAFSARAVLAGVLFGLSPADPVALSGAAIAIVAIAFAAAYLPARRASRIDPVVAIKYE